MFANLIQWPLVDASAIVISWGAVEQKARRPIWRILAIRAIERFLDFRAETFQAPLNCGLTIPSKEEQTLFASCYFNLPGPILLFAFSVLGNSVHHAQVATPAPGQAAFFIEWPTKNPAGPTIEIKIPNPPSGRRCSQLTLRPNATKRRPVTRQDRNFIKTDARYKRPVARRSASLLKKGKKPGARPDALLLNHFLIKSSINFNQLVDPPLRGPAVARERQVR